MDFNTASPIGRRYLVWITFGLIMGISFGLILPATTNFSLLFRIAAGLLTGLLLIYLMLRCLKKTITLPIADCFLFGFVLLAFLLGILRVYHFDFVRHKDLRDTAELPHQYIGVLTDDPTLSNSGKTYEFPIRVLSMETDGNHQTVSGSILLYAPLDLSRGLTRGSTVSFSATLSAPRDASYFGGFSLKDYLYRQNYLFQVYTDTLSPVHASYQFGFMDQIRFQGESIRDSILNSIDQSFGESSEESTLLKGILLGADEGLSPEQYQNFIDSGLIHITSVSGMHVVFLSGFILVSLRKLRIPKRLHYLILIPVLFLFTSVSAFTPSVCRSTIMMLFFILSQLFQRDPDSLTSLSISALILLLINPYNLTSYSFLLSFSSSLGIILYAQPVQGYLLRPFRRKIDDKNSPASVQPFWYRSLIKPACASLSMSFGCFLGMGFFGAQFFQRITWGGFLANLCLLPFASATFLLGLFNWPVFCFSPELSRLIAGIPLKFMLWCINRIASVFSYPFFRIVTPTPSFAAILPYSVFCVALYFTLKQSSKNNT